MPPRDLVNLGYLILPHPDFTNGMPSHTNLVFLFTGDGSDWVNPNWTEEELEAHYERKRCEARRKERIERAWDRMQFNLFETIQ